MKRSKKAALLSCFAFPGAGHLYLKRFALGLLLSFGAAVSVYFILSSAVNTALEIAQKIQDGGVPLDVETIAGLVSQQTRASGGSTDNALIALVALWLIGICDSYRVGRALESKQSGGG